METDLKKKEDDDKPEGGEALNKLFKDIYGNADEDTRRAMVKPFVSRSVRLATRDNCSTQWPSQSNSSMVATHVC